MHETRGDRRLPEPVPSPCAAGRGPGARSTTRHETPPLSVVFNWGYTKRPTCSARAERTLCKENCALRHVRSSRDHAAARCAPGPHAGRSGVGVDLRAPGVDLGWGGVVPPTSGVLHGAVVRGSVGGGHCSGPGTVGSKTEH